MKRLPGFILALALACSFTREAPAQIPLQQSTASQAVKFGPFVSSTDGNTESTALTIANTDIKCSKNGGSLASKNSGGGTHDANGWYTVTFDAIDTNTAGRLTCFVHVSGALPVFREFMVYPTANYAVAYSTAPGASGGLLIAGTNADFDVTANASFAGGVTITQSTSNAAALVVTGNGTGNGATITSGSGATGTGLAITSSATNGTALTVLGAGTGNGATITSGSGATGNALALTAAATNGQGLTITGTGVGSGASIASGSGANAQGLTIASFGSGSSAHGVSIAGAGTGAGMSISSGGGATGDALVLNATSTNGDGLRANGNGTGSGIHGAGGSTGHGLFVASGGGATGNGAQFTAQSTNGNAIGVTATGTGLIFSTPANVNLTQIAAAAVNTATAQLGVNVVNVGGTAQTARDIGASVPAATAGASGGLSINGTNAGNRTFSGTTTYTGNVGYSDGITITRSTSNQPAWSATGNGTGDGIRATSGSGATGNGASFVAASTNGSGVSKAGAGTGAGDQSTGGATGAGYLGVGGSTSGLGFASTFTAPSGAFTESGMNRSGTLNGTHSFTTADLGTNAPTRNIACMTVYFPDHDLSELITSYNTSTGVATFATTTTETLVNGDDWFLYGTPCGAAGTLTASDVWTYSTRVLTAGTNIALAKGTGVTGFNDVSSSQVEAALGNLPLSSYTTSGTAGERLGRIPNAAPAAAGGLPTVNASNQVAGVSGNVLGSVASVSGNVGGSVGSVTGNVGGNVVGNVNGSVGSLGTTAQSNVQSATEAALNAHTIGGGELLNDMLCRIASVLYGAADYQTGGDLTVFKNPAGTLTRVTIPYGTDNGDRNAVTLGGACGN